MQYLFSTLTVVTFAPLVGVVVLLFLRPEQKNAIRWVALITSLATFLLSLVMLGQFNRLAPGLQLEINAPWIRIGSTWQIGYHMAVDGLSLLLILLTTFLTPLSIASTWTAIEERVKEFMIFFLLLEVGMTGVFMAQDLFLFYIFWEFTLVPMYFLIGIWGGPRKIYAALKFFLYTMAGSILMLLAILYLGITLGTFSVPEIIARAGSLDLTTQLLLFWGFAAAFAIKVPIWPLHSWLPDAHVEAPTAGSVILAGVLLKLGTYGFVRFNLGMFPDAAVRAAPVLAVLGVIGILYGAIVSYAQTDAKKLVAYSSVSHLGFVILGLFALNAQGIQGAILQMVNHGISTGALFLLVGMIYERRHTRDMAQFGGLWKIMPVYGALFLIVVLSSMGLPGLNGFIGEFAILLGAWGAGQPGGPLGSYLYAAFGALGVILAAIYLLWLFQRLFLGEVTNEKNRGLSDLNRREILIMIPLIVLIFWIGLYPKPFLDLLSPSVEHLASTLQAAAVALR
ncbi:MAG: NADH-quinone oxidoreductase subunit M [Anaerolineales bacterium]|nr:NADH-quinone oxidoreductase subunit M [Anaerolineales bacterium]